MNKTKETIERIKVILESIEDNYKLIMEQSFPVEAIGEYPEGHKKDVQALSHAIETLQAVDSIEGLPERKELRYSYCRRKKHSCGFCHECLEDISFNKAIDIARVLLGKRDQEILELKNVGILARKIVDGLQAEIKALKANKPSVEELVEIIRDKIRWSPYGKANYTMVDSFEETAQAIHDYKRGEV